MIVDLSILRSRSAEEKALFETALKALHLKPEIFSCTLPECSASFDTFGELSDHEWEAHGGSPDQIKEGLEDAPKETEGRDNLLGIRQFRLIISTQERRLRPLTPMNGLN